MSTIATKYGYDKLGNRNMVIDPKENVTYFNYDLQGRLRSTISPDGNIAYYEYNNVGSLTSKKDENSDTIDYTYDNLYRLTRKDYPDSTHAYFTYDAVGRRLHMQDPNTLTYFEYDAGGRLTSTHDCILDKTISYTYDKVGRRDSMTDPEGDVIYYDYDSVKLIRIKRNTDEEAYYAYDAAGRRNFALLGNGSYTYYDYDVNSRLVRVANHKSDDSVISTFDYTLDAVGNRIAMQINSGDTVYYEYDGIYQLVQEDRRQSDDSLVYINYFEYDLAGNRTHLHYVDSGTDDWTYYTFNIENQLTIEEKGGIATYYTYDPAGALLRKKVGETVSYYEYNYDGLMDRFNEGETVATYTFDTDSRRIEKDVDGTVSKYEYNGADVIAEYDGDDVLQATFNTPALDQNLTQKRSGNVYHYLQDGLGSVRNILDANEAIQNTYDYAAFGTVYGTPTENVSNPFRFTGRRWDSESSLHFYRTRMYNQLIGRFGSQDKLTSSAFINGYVYVANLPTNAVDPLGLYTVLFKGHHSASAASINHLVMMVPAQILNNFGEKANVYDHYMWETDAFTELQTYLDSEDYKKDGCPAINIAGYSCGTDSALAFARKIDPIIQDKENELGIEIPIENLIYVDFNWGTVHCTDCRHETGNNYMPPSRVKKVTHFVSTGEMSIGKPPKTWEHEGNSYKTPGGSIKWHTVNLWSAWLNPGDGVDFWGLVGRGHEVMNSTIIDRLSPRAIAAASTVANTSGVFTSVAIGMLLGWGWPVETRKEKNYLDHAQIGDNADVAIDIIITILDSCYTCH